MKRIFTLTLAGALGLPILAGCESSSDRPYGLTGEDRPQMSHSERLRYTDQKGHYRPEYAARKQEIRPVPRRD